MRILITGASGFIGSFLVEKALEKGFEVWAGIRSSSSRAYLQDKRIHFIELPFANESKLTAQLSDFKVSGGKWDYIIHAAGVTKGKDDSFFLENNYKATCHFVSALRSAQILPQRFVYLSSLSVLGAIRQEPSNHSGVSIYETIKDTDKAEPNTSYGRSKLASELFLQQQTDLNYVIMRPTGVYGPREKDYYLMAKSICHHIDFSVGYKPQEITFVYVKDLVDAIFLALEKGEQGRSYLVSDGETHKSSDFSNLLQKEIGIKHVLHLNVPLCILKLVCFFSELVSKKTAKMTALNNDKYNILKQRNWRCDISSISELGYIPKYNLQKGVAETVAWYKKEKWI